MPKSHLDEFHILMSSFLCKGWQNETCFFSVWSFMTKSNLSFSIEKQYLHKVSFWKYALYQERISLRADDKQRRDPCSGPQRTLRILGNAFRISLQPDWRSRQTKQRSFLTGQSWRVLKSGYTAGTPEQGIRRCFTHGVNQSLISSARRLRENELRERIPVPHDNFF